MVKLFEKCQLRSFDGGLQSAKSNSQYRNPESLRPFHVHYVNEVVCYALLGCVLIYDRA